jgi:hypothetical protein
VRLGIAPGDWNVPATPRPPLVMNSTLLAVARAHAKDMADRKFFGHTNPDGTTSNDRVRNSGYPLDVPLDPPGGNSVENLSAGQESAAISHDRLVVDAGTVPPNHRNMMFGVINSMHDEIGIGIEFTEIITGVDDGHGGQFDTKNFFAQEYAHDNDLTPFVTGVVFVDDNGNGFYDVGEGRGGVTVETTDGTYSTTTASAGGYGFPATVAGSFTFRASGGGLSRPIEVAADVSANESVKVDFSIQDFTTVKSSWKVDFKKRTKKGIPNPDSATLKAMIPATALPSDLTGTSLTVSLGDREFGPYVLDAKGKFGSPGGAEPKEKVKLNGKSGVLVLKLKKADLMAAVGAVDETATVTRDLEVRIRLGETFDATKTVPHEVKSKQGKSEKGKFTN